MPSLNLLWCAQASASVSCMRSAARSGLRAMDLANARSRSRSASNPVRNGSEFWRGTLPRFGSEFDDNSDNRPFAPYTEGHRRNRRYVRASRPGATRRTASYLQISPSRGSAAVCLYGYRSRHSPHKQLSPRRGSCRPAARFAGKRATEGGAATTPRIRFRPALTIVVPRFGKYPTRLRAVDGRRV